MNHWCRSINRDRFYAEWHRQCEERRRALFCLALYAIAADPRAQAEET